jgi:transcriptional regulator with XRE-family HTH domain
MEHTEKEVRGIGACIREGREKAGMSQEDLAERLGVSRQAVSKWEMGMSVPTLENLKALSEVLGISFEEEAGKEKPNEMGSEGKPKKSPVTVWKVVALVCLVVCLVFLLGLIGTIMLMPYSWEQSESVIEADTEEIEEVITGITFFDTQGQRLHPDQGDNWLAFSTGSQVVTAVTFRGDANVHGVALYLTPTGTETYDLREQIALCSVDDGDTVALLLWEVPEDVMGHMEVVLECDGGQTYSRMVNVIAEV